MTDTSDSALTPEKAPVDLQTAVREWIDEHDFPKESHARAALDLVLRDAWTDMVRDRRQAEKNKAPQGHSPLPEGEGLGVGAADDAPDPDDTDGNASSLTPDS